MELKEVIKKLRKGESIRLYREKMFTTIQLNRNSDKICWERHVSVDKKNWTVWNEFLSLKDVIKIYSEYEKRETN